MNEVEGDNTLPRGPSRSVRPPPTRARLHIVGPPELVKTIELQGERVVLGRHGAGDHALRHPTVSRAHLEIGWEPDTSAYTARDLDSHNGSAIDGERLAATRRTLSHNAVLRIGDVLGVFEIAADPEGADRVDPAAVPGISAAARALRVRMTRAGTDPAPALLVGETGTGKERIAAELHRLSERSGPLVAVNCAALSAHLVESQLLGHVRGAFTGALGDQPGLIRSAGGGTIFFDEVGELPLDLQPKLLRVVQEREVLPVGGTRAVKVDVRMIAASNRDLARHVEEGRFRRDLYARLAMWELRIPPLRERRADLFLWLRILHTRHLQERRRPEAPLTIHADVAERLLLARWDDNLRGLDRLVHSVVDSGQITALPDWLATRADAPIATPPAPRMPIPSREELAEVFARHGGSVRATARHFGRDRKQIYRWLEAHGLRGSDETED